MSANSGIVSRVSTKLAPSFSQSKFGEVLSVASGATSLVVSYQMPVGASGFLQSVEMSGDNIATYDIKLNGVTIARKRTGFGGSFCEIADFSAMALVSNDLVQIYVFNFRPILGNFEARIQYQGGV